MMAEQCLELLTKGYKRYLNTTFTRDHDTFGDACGPGKISYQIIIYDNGHTQNIGHTNQQPYNSSQKKFITMMRMETLSDPNK